FFVVKVPVAALACPTGRGDLLTAANLLQQRVVRVGLLVVVATHVVPPHVVESSQQPEDSYPEQPHNNGSCSNSVPARTPLPTFAVRPSGAVVEGGARGRCAADSAGQRPVLHA